MVPFPKNDHSIQYHGPVTDGLDALYEDYVPLFRPIKGKKWILESNAVTVDDPSLKVNAFEINSGHAFPIVSSGSASSATITIQSIKGVKADSEWTVCLPGNKCRNPLAIDSTEDRLSIEVPLERGCGLLLAEPTEECQL
jgi:hypothetical protein